MRGPAAVGPLLQRNDPSASSRGIAVKRTYFDNCRSIFARNDKRLPSSTPDSGLRRMERIGVFVVACCLLPTTVGCMRFPVRHGMIVKGDWSLEMNRIPWMKSRGNAYQQAPEAGTTQNMCVAEIDSPFAAGGARIPSGLPMACGKGGCGSAAQCESTVGYQAHARFHPVPTRSVFANEPTFAPTTSEQTRPVTLPPAGRTPKLIEPPPLPPETEVIPAPPASPETPKDQAAAHRETGLGQMSWVFSPTTAGNESVPDDAPRYAAGGAPRTIR